MKTIEEIGDCDAFHTAIDDAFPGTSVEVATTGGTFEVTMRQPGLLRPLRAAELSDGTLRYLLLAAALLTPRPPELLVLNEPETSLHPDLLPALARLVTATAEKSQIIVVSHAPRLIDALSSEPACHLVALQRTHGETVIANIPWQEQPPWRWPAR